MAASATDGSAASPLDRMMSRARAMRFSPTTSSTSRYFWCRTHSLMRNATSDGWKRSQNETGAAG